MNTAHFKEKPQERLSVAEKLLLLALDDSDGHILLSASTGIRYGLAGAILMDLAEQGFFEISDKEVVLKRTDQPEGHPANALVVNYLASSQKPRTWRRMITSLVNHGKFGAVVDLLKKGLIEKQILRESAQKILWIFPYKRYPTLDARPERRVRETLREILIKGRMPDYQEAVLVGLVRVCNLGKELFPNKKERKLAAERMKALTEETALGQAVQAVMKEIETSVMLATVVSTAVHTAS